MSGTMFLFWIGGGHRTPNRQGRANRGLSESGGLGRRDNDCFGSGIEDFQINEEFDFEKNLALFDKVKVVTLHIT